jgi:BioD-like phosphotransacetylase family protein
MTNDLKTALLELAQVPDKRSTTARVAEHFAEIEAALNAGVQRTGVLETLNRHGITLSLKNFDNVLNRLRKKHVASTSQDRDSTPLTIAPERSETKGIALATSNPRSEASPRQAETSAAALPEDWMTAKLTPAQFRLLSPKQSRAKIDAETARYFPNRFKPKASGS